MTKPLIKKIQLVSLYLFAMAPTLVLASHHTIATVATSVTTQVDAVVKLLNITAYIAGVGFALSGILQFKTHKENPQQVPLSKPIMMILVAACLLFLPTVLTIAGNSMFGHNANSAATAGGSKNLSGH